jgi:thiol-disulfide isomerase/thioredoxin
MQKDIDIIAVCCLLAACGGLQKNHYITVPDAKTKVLKGIINHQILQQDSAFRWFTANQQWGSADANAVTIFNQNQHKFTLLVFGGTWCEDTQNLWPVFYRLVFKSGYPTQKITLVAVDRNKQALNQLAQQYHITHVPTFIVLQHGKEVGRVVEYGTQGAIDKELGQIVQQLR